MYKLTKSTIKTSIENIVTLQYINLRYLFVAPTDSLPDLISDNVVYMILNTVTLETYIGKTSNLFTRFRYHGASSHLRRYKDHCIESSTSKLYQAIESYGARYFEVHILATNNDPDQLTELEIYWINRLRSYIGFEDSRGYNMTLGGLDSSHMNTSECLEKRLNTIASQYDGDCAGQLHTKEAQEIAIYKRTLTKNFDNIYYCLNEIRQSPDDIITGERYWRDIPYEGSVPLRHVKHVVASIDNLRLDDRWTEEMENIFSWIIDNVLS